MIYYSKFKLPPNHYRWINFHLMFSLFYFWKQILPKIHQSAMAMKHPSYMLVIKVTQCHLKVKEQ